MRAISYFYVEKINQEELTEEIKKWRDANFTYVPYHWMVSFNSINPNENLQTRGRPYALNCGLIRDSVISKSAVGVLIVTDEFEESMYQPVANLIKDIQVDLGISNFQLVTSYLNDDRKIDIIKLQAAIANATESFVKLK